MTTNLFGNPHSASASSQLSSRRIDDCRLRILNLFKASPQDFDLVFVANATAGIKLVADAFRDHDEGFWYGYHAESHTSLIGVRELASCGNRCFRDDQEISDWVALDGCESNERNFPRLLAYPAQSNMTGRRLSLDWCRNVRNMNIKGAKLMYTLLDAAGLVSTSPLDLSDVSVAPDFTVLSFYKMFGFPDLGALIVRKASGEPLKRRKYFGGGTVNMTISIGEQWHDKRDSSLHSQLEDGTVPFHSIVALECALNVHSRLYGSMEAVSRHTTFLQTRMFLGLSLYRHFNGNKVCEIYGDHLHDAGKEITDGATIAFNLRNCYGGYIAKTEVEKLATVKSIQFRTGGLCNPGGVATHLELSPSDMKKHFAAGQRCGDNNDIIDGRPTGVIRISLGASSNLRDVDAFLGFIEEFYVERHPRIDPNLSPPTPPPTPPPSEFHIENLSIFPIKSCGAFNIPSGIYWKIKPQGLAWDREWCLIHQGTGAALSQKRFPRMTLLEPELDFVRQVLRVTHTDSDGYPETIEVNLSRENEGRGATNTSNCLSPTTSTVCGDDMTVQVYTSLEIADYFSSFLEVPCTLARHSPAASRMPKSRFSPVPHISRPPSMPGSFPSSPPSSPPLPSSSRLHFSNESPILLVSRSSVDKLNETILANANATASNTNTDTDKHSPPATISPSVFRSNIIIASSTTTITTTNSAPPTSHLAFAEESWKHFSISPSPSNSASPTITTTTSNPPTSTSTSTTLTVLGPCQRCQMVCIDQATGQRSKSAEPFATLAKMRRREGGKVEFGVHLCLDEEREGEEGEERTIAVGDLVRGWA